MLPLQKGTARPVDSDHTLRERRANSASPVPLGPGIDDIEHVLTDVVGATGDGPNAIVEHFRLADDDVLLLCTNGLTDVVDDDRIADALASRRAPVEQCDLLVNLAVGNGAVDNVTVVLANYHVKRSETDGAQPD